MSKITDAVEILARPVCEANGCELWDVEYVKEAGQWVLRIYIDKSGGVSINDCETVSRQLDPILDEEDPIPMSYTFEVSSAGAERALKRPSDFGRFIGDNVEIKLYKGINGSKAHSGTLKSYENGNVTIEEGGNLITFEKDLIAGVHLKLVF